MTMNSFEGGFVQIEKNVLIPLELKPLYDLTKEKDTFCFIIHSDVSDDSSKLSA